MKTTELIARGAAIPDLGISEAVDAAAFSLPQGGVSDAISTPTGTAIDPRGRKGRTSPTRKSRPARIELREELVNQRRDKFFGAYMQKAKTSAQDQRRATKSSRAITGV